MAPHASQGAAAAGPAGRCYSVQACAVKNEQQVTKGERSSRRTRTCRDAACSCVQGPHCLSVGGIMHQQLSTSGPAAQSGDFDLTTHCIWRTGRQQQTQDTLSA